MPRQVTSAAPESGRESFHREARETLSCQCDRSMARADATVACSIVGHADRLRMALRVEHRAITTLAVTSADDGAASTSLFYYYSAESLTRSFRPYWRRRGAFVSITSILIRRHCPSSIKRSSVSPSMLRHTPSSRSTSSPLRRNSIM